MKFKENLKKKNFIEILNNKNETINIKTPMLKCPFGLEEEYNKFLVKLELTNYKNDLEINNFFKQIISIEEEVKKFMEKDELFYNDIIRYSDKFDPLIKFYLPFRYDKFEVDFYKNKNLTTSKEITKGCKLKLDLDVLSIWKFQNKYGINFKVKKINIF